jgi:hypothetical protein
MRIPYRLMFVVRRMTTPLACLFPLRQANGRDTLSKAFWFITDDLVDRVYYDNYEGPSTPIGHYDYDHSVLVRFAFRLVSVNEILIHEYNQMTGRN